jgi:rhodanese-related sulfurtransferase
MKETAIVSVGDLARRRAQSAVDVIDVRTPVEFRAMHMVGARNVPLDSLDPHVVMEQRNGANDPLYLICQSGGRGAAACRKFCDAGYANVVNVEGGTQAWVEAGLPVERGNKSISLERQVRIAAGSLVLIGTVLGFFVHPYFLALTAFIGAGLLFAGLTDTCGMAMLLAKMPWNQAPKICNHS